MIDEQKLIERIKEMPNTCNLFRWRSSKKIKAGLVSLIAREPKISEWIPCNERLPESEQRCLVSVVWEDEGAKTYSVYDAVYGSDAKWHSHNYEGMICCMIYCKVVAWQPLPEPYKE
ncbi:MAG: DUF551 domain-containing protein [Lachnospiraceae bacterium]|nr:DUF551 domain-containing protein [Lachnospiraceae bacterium]